MNNSLTCLIKSKPHKQDFPYSKCSLVLLYVCPCYCINISRHLLLIKRSMFNLSLTHTYRLYPPTNERTLYVDSRGKNLWRQPLSSKFATAQKCETQIDRNSNFNNSIFRAGSLWSRGLREETRD